jgi:integral membrane protein (TIGR01906 family)
MNVALDAFDWARAVLSVAFVLFVPLLIIGTSLRGLVTDRGFILQGFRDNQVSNTTGLDDAQLQRVADAFVAYFQAPPGTIQMEVTAFGQQRPLFNDREVAHMQDVQALVQLFLKLQVVAAAVGVLRLVFAAVFDRNVVPIGRELLWATALMLGVVILVAALSLLDFDALWIRFHQVAFRNDLWQLDPSRDYLIMLFPEPFWFAATIRMAVSVAVQTTIVALVGIGCVISPRLISASSPRTPS